MARLPAIYSGPVLFLVLCAPALRGAEPVHFVRDVVPLLTKLGCSSGACHGSFQGRGGFRLSLLGFDPQADFDALAREARGRRVFPAAPEQSLILLKPTMVMPHGGKKRFGADSEPYRVLRDWIAQGLKGPGETPVHVTRLEVTPGEVVQKPGQAVALRVRATWSDGVVQDATRLALYESTSETVAEVSALGEITGRGAGRTAVTVRYMGQVAAVPVTLPYGTEASAEKPARNNFIDDFIIAEWKKLGLKPAPLADDSEFLRRVSFDLIGTLPTAEEVRRFRKDPRPDKRARLIDELLERPDYVDYWALKWGDLLRAHSRSLGQKGLGSFNVWLRTSLRESRPVDRMVRELLTAKGNLYANGPAAFYYVDRTPEDLAETTAQVFLGVRLQCTKCHHHPFEVWTQDDYYGMAAFFAKVERKDTGDDGAFGGAQSVRLTGKATVTNPATGKPAALQGFGWKPAPGEESGDPRPALAAWITAKDNPYFARNYVNRAWGYLFGRGLVDPIDDLRATNPASHPALLDALAKDWIDHNCDWKHLLRTIANSRTYQLECEVAPEKDREGRFFASQRPRRLPGEVLLDAINQATMTQESFDKVAPGTRAIALMDPTAISYFLDTFGRPRRTSTCECERANRPDLSQALHLANSETLHQKVTSPNGRVARLLKKKVSDEVIVEDLYLSTLSRLPTKKELATVRELVAKAPSRQEGLEDLLWTLLNCAEFLFNH